jgi:protein-disulfide isomerase
LKFGALTILALAALIATAATAAPRDTVFPDDRTLGNPKAPVTVIEYLAPTCPHCARFAATVFPGIKKNYIDTGKVLYVIRIFPLSPADGGVAGLAKCQAPGRYYAFLDLAFRKQAMWDPNGYDIPDLEAALVQLAGLAGLNADDAKRCMKDEQEFSRINRIAQDAVDRYQIESVPSIIVDGKALTGETDASYPALKTRIDGLLANAVSAAPRHPVPRKAAVHQHRTHQPVHHQPAKKHPKKTKAAKVKRH